MITAIGVFGVSVPLQLAFITGILVYFNSINLRLCMARDFTIRNLNTKYTSMKINLKKMVDKTR